MNKCPIFLQEPIGATVSSRCFGNVAENNTSLSVYVPWSAAEYDKYTPPRPSGFDGPVEERLEERFRRAYEKPFPHIQDPCVLVDIDGIILAWYLPAGLTVERQVRGKPSNPELIVN